MSKVGRPTFMKVGCPTLPKLDVLLWIYWTSNFGHVTWTLLLAPDTPGGQKAKSTVLEICLICQ